MFWKTIPSNAQWCNDYRHLSTHCQAALRLHHRFPGNFFIICVSPFGNEKSPCSPKGTRTENTIFCGTTLFAGKNRPLCRRQHAVCPVTLAMRQKILGDIPFPSALGGPFAAPLFAPLSALRDSLWMRWQLYFRFFGLPFELGIFIHQKSPFVKNFFPRHKDFFFLFQENYFQYSRTTPFTSPRIWAWVPSMGA